MQCIIPSGLLVLLYFGQPCTELWRKHWPLKLAPWLDYLSCSILIVKQNPLFKLFDIEKGRMALLCPQKLKFKFLSLACQTRPNLILCTFSKVLSCSLHTSVLWLGGLTQSLPNISDRSHLFILGMSDIEGCLPISFLGTHPSRLHSFPTSHYPTFPANFLSLPQPNISHSFLFICGPLSLIGSLIFAHILLS